MAEKSKIIKAASTGYNYKFASLADIVMQGYDLPRMRVAVHEGVDYIEYFDGKEWNLGAKVVPLENKSNNAAQNYGASLSYARRYTALMALQLATSDDDLVEFDTTKISEVLGQALTVDQLNEIYQTVPDRYKNSVKKAFTNRKKELESTHDAIVKVNRNA